MFDKCVNQKAKGDIGEARAIYEFTKGGHTVCKPLSEGNHYDLIVDKYGLLFRVQVKTTSMKNKYGIYKVDLRTRGGNKTCDTFRLREDDDYDILFVLVEDGGIWEIPTSEMKDARSAINLGKKYEQFKL